MSIEDDVNLLASIPTLRLLGIEAVRVLAIGSEIRTIRRDDTLFEAGDDADGGYVVRSGAIRVSSDESGIYRDIVAGPGHLIGELALVVDMKRPATAVAIADSSVIRISRSLFQRVLEGHPDAAHRLRDYFATRTTQAASEMLVASGKLVS
jgi:CRP-like cAMP-binding protein